MISKVDQARIAHRAASAAVARHDRECDTCIAALRDLGVRCTDGLMYAIRAENASSDVADAIHAEEAAASDQASLF